MQPEISKEGTPFRRVSRPALTKLLQEAGALQVFSQNFALLSLAASTLNCDTVASHLYIREALQGFLATWSRLRHVEADLLSGCEPALMQIMNDAFTQDVEEKCARFEAMARNICNLHRRGLSPTITDLSELVVFVSRPLSDANNVIATAAKQVVETARTDAERLALTDLLTGLPNRRALQDVLNRKKTDWHQDGDVAIMHVDLDNFKKINDLMGHAAGDAALIHAANAMTTHMTGDDFLARVGGMNSLWSSLAQTPKPRWKNVPHR